MFREFIVSVCYKFGRIAVKLAIRVNLCCDECIVSVCCIFGAVTTKMTIRVNFCCHESIASIFLRIWWDCDENGRFVFICVAMNSL